MASTKDEKFRAFDKETGKILWEKSCQPEGMHRQARIWLKANNM
ncbi:MAG: hypothetical protein WKG06_31820 [Segetibacter sp.]